jgi:hypothetical protein
MSFTMKISFPMKNVKAVFYIHEHGRRNGAPTFADTALLCVGAAFRRPHISV